MPDDRIESFGHQLLNNVGDGLESAGLTLPTRRYFTTGQIALDFTDDDCGGQFVVSWGGMLPAGNRGQIIKCAVPFVARFFIGLFRCVPTLHNNREFPTADELDDSGTETGTDAMTLASTLVSLQMSGNLLDNSCGEVGILDISPYGPSGGVGGTVATLAISLLNG